MQVDGGAGFSFSDNLFTQNTYGIYNPSGTVSVARRNTFAGGTYGLYGISIYQDNLAVAVSAPFSGGTDAGGNFSNSSND